MSAEKALYLIVSDKLEEDSLQLPGLPTTAEQVRQVTADPNCNLQDLVTIIQHDPALTARLIGLANSAYLGGRSKTETLMQALTRIGLRRIRNLALALAIEQLYIARNSIVRGYLDETWQRSRELAAASVVLVEQLMERKVGKRMHPDIALLAGLIAPIGALPILSVVDEHADSFANPTFIAPTIAHLQARIGTEVLKHWQFSPLLIEVPNGWPQGRAERLQRPEDINYADIVHAAGLLTGHCVATTVMTLAEYQQIGLLESDELWNWPAIQTRYQEVLAVLM